MYSLLAFNRCDHNNQNKIIIKYNNEKENRSRKLENEP